MPERERGCYNNTEKTVSPSCGEGGFEGLGYVRVAVPVVQDCIHL